MIIEIYENLGVIEVNKENENKNLIFGLTNEGRLSAANEKRCMEIVETGKLQGHLFIGTFHGSPKNIKKGEQPSLISQIIGNEKNKEK
ncbi:hypothetical protein MC28_D089 (plasmid) [Bacillus thuringiensis MC28]|nr:hypothetical protein MC28_D089 [Bacillus thuringiensis MC28]